MVRIWDYYIIFFSISLGCWLSADLWLVIYDQAIIYVEYTRAQSSRGTVDRKLNVQTSKRRRQTNG